MVQLPPVDRQAKYYAKSVQKLAGVVTFPHILLVSRHKSSGGRVRPESTAEAHYKKFSAA